MSEPAPTSPPPSAYTDAATLAARLGISRRTLYQHLSHERPYVPKPTKLAGRWVWLTSDLEGIEAVPRPLGNPNFGPGYRPERKPPTPEDAPE
ncbi:AlpA family transcriptional regulator [Cellulomonas sp. KRMCY2]|uniref:helix-turn-helix transcriptional regulator n=1 Tax=Cellulomonas sp. KRMCY2 TaxID=1304865 RepID=UPI00045E8641|nr:hypothetical protein [Cellulomonas sp. KRMCY2]